MGLQTRETVLRVQTPILARKNRATASEPPELAEWGVCATTSANAEASCDRRTGGDLVLVNAAIWDLFAAPNTRPALWAFAGPHCPPLC